MAGTTARGGGDGVDSQGGTSGGYNSEGGYGVSASGGGAQGGGGGGVGVSGQGGSGSFGGSGVSAAGGTGGHTGGDGIDAIAGSGSPNGMAGSFTGDVTISGNLSVSGTKNFRIDHPLDPANKYLYHASIESSEVLNLYSGNVTLAADGTAAVQLPAWFETLNRDFRYQLTAIGAPGSGLYIAQEIQNHSFRIAGGPPGIKVSWQVTGVRQDAWEKTHPMVVEVQKPAAEQGYYLNPELYGAPEEKGVEWARHPQIMRRMQAMREKQASRAQSLKQ